MSIEDNLRALLPWDEHRDRGNDIKVALLIALANNPEVQIRRLAAQVGRAISTTHRHLSDLENIGLVLVFGGRRRVSRKVAAIVSGELFGDAVREPFLEPMEAIL